VKDKERKRKKNVYNEKVVFDDGQMVSRQTRRAVSIGGRKPSKGGGRPARGKGGERPGKKGSMLTVGERTVYWDSATRNDLDTRIRGKGSLGGK